MEFGAFLRAKRQEKGMSLRQLALYADCSRSYLSLLERGLVGKSVSPQYLRKLSKPLSVSYEVLMAAAGYIMEQDDELLLSGSIVFTLREALGDSVEMFAGRVDMTPYEIEQLEQNGVSYETLDSLYRKLFESHRKLSQSQKNLVQRLEGQFQNLNTEKASKLEIAVHVVAGLVEGR